MTGRDLAQTKISSFHVDFDELVRRKDGGLMVWWSEEATASNVPKFVTATLSSRDHYRAASSSQKDAVDFLERVNERIPLTFYSFLEIL